jgi:hypothetical protein
MVSLAFFVIVYSFLSLLLVMAWRGLCLFAKPPVVSANFLFWLRLLPFALSTIVTLFLAFPSFLLMEAHALDEDFGTFVLFLCSLVVLGAGLFRVGTAEARTRRAVTAWLMGAGQVEAGEAASSDVALSDVVPILLVGIRRPRVLVSETARALLTEGELRVAVQHEMEHLRSRDNLKKAMLNFVLFPGMSRLHQGWQEAAEFDADLRAVTNRKEALDLASALVKLSRALPLGPAPVLATGLVDGTESIATRVERLLAWESGSHASLRQSYVIVPLVFAAILGLAAHLGPALVVTHSLTERLVP